METYSLIGLATLISALLLLTTPSSSQVTFTRDWPAGKRAAFDEASASNTDYAHDSSKSMRYILWLQLIQGPKNDIRRMYDGKINPFTEEFHLNHLEVPNDDSYHKHRF